MKIAVFGSTGGTGRQIVAQPLAARHEVAAFTRQSTASLEPRQGLTVVCGSTLDQEAVARAIAGRDAVLCALGGHPLRRRECVCSTAVQSIASAMRDLNVRRIIAISTFGAGDTRSHVGLLARTLLFGLILRSEVADKEAMEAHLAASDLDWTVVRIGVLADGEARGAWRAADDGTIRGMGKVARSDVAAFMLAQLESNAWVRRRPVLQY